MTDHSDEVEKGNVPVPVVRFRWAHVSLPQAAKDVIQVVSGFMIAALFIIWGVFGPSAVNKQNHEILQGVQVQLEQHAHGSAERNCALADELAYLASHPAKVNGERFKLTRSPEQLRRIDQLRDQACSVHDIPKP